MSRRFSFAFISVIPILNLVSACTTFYGEPNYIVNKNVVFKVIGDEKLMGDIYVPKQPGLKPAVIVVHGGGWSKKSGDMESICKALAEAGFVVFSPTYRMAPANRFPKPLEDVKDSIIWFKENAAQYESDPTKITAWGYSAGAHLLLLAGLDPKMGIKAIVAGGTPADLTVWPDSPLVNDLMGFPRDSNLEAWKQASPINHVQNDSPPVFLYHGQWDFIVEVNQMEKMRQALLAKGRLVETYTISFAGHIAVYFFSRESVNRGIAFINRIVKNK